MDQVAGGMDAIGRSNPEHTDLGPEPAPDR